MTPKPEDLIVKRTPDDYRKLAYGWHHFTVSAREVVEGVMEAADALESLLSERDQLKLERDVLEHRLLKYQKVVEAARGLVRDHDCYGKQCALCLALKELP
jgi:hypothetical protein